MNKKDIYYKNFKTFPKFDNFDKISRQRAYKIFDFWGDNFQTLNFSNITILKTVFPDFKLKSYETKEEFIACFYTNIRFFFISLESCKSKKNYFDINNTIIIAVFLMVINKKTLSIFGTNQKEFLELSKNVFNKDNYKYTEKNNNILIKMFNYIWDDPDFIKAHGKITLKTRNEVLKCLNNTEEINNE